MGQLVKITLVYVVFNINQLNNFSPSQSFQEIAVVINIKGRGGGNIQINMQISKNMQILVPTKDCYCMVRANITLVCGILEINQVYLSISGFLFLEMARDSLI